MHMHLSIRMCVDVCVCARVRLSGQVCMRSAGKRQGGSHSHGVCDVICPLEIMARGLLGVCVRMCMCGGRERHGLITSREKVRERVKSEELHRWLRRWGQCTMAIRHVIASCRVLPPPLAYASLDGWRCAHVDALACAHRHSPSEDMHERSPRATAETQSERDGKGLR